MSTKKVTDLEQIDNPANEDVLHIVDDSDTSQDSAGSSKKILLSQLKTFIDADVESVWGNITGTLSDQTDLQNALNSKSNVGHTHTESDITDLNKYTQTEVDTLLSSKYDSANFNTDFDTRFGLKSTTDLTEGTNLYYTEGRVSANTNVSANTTHRTSDGKDHSDVVLNNSYRAVGHIPLSQKGSNSGVAELDSGGKVPSSQLPSTVMDFKGNWNASTNTPTLANGTGNAGDVYLVSVAGTQNLGSGSITFAEGDWLVYNGTIWEKSINSNKVVSVNGQQGVVSLDTDDIDDTSTNRYTNDTDITRLANTSGTNTGDQNLQEVTDNGSTTTNDITVGGINIGGTDNYKFFYESDTEIDSVERHTKIFFDEFVQESGSSNTVYPLIKFKDSFDIGFVSESNQGGFADSLNIFDVSEDGLATLSFQQKDFTAINLSADFNNNLLGIDNNLRIRAFESSAENGLILSVVPFGSGTDEDRWKILPDTTIGDKLFFENQAGSNVVEITQDGDMETNSFIKTGGTSAQFLKADGSVDSSTYLTTETDPVFSASQASNITATDITNLGNLSGTNTGDQDLSGLVSYTGATGNVDLGANDLSANNQVSHRDFAFNPTTDDDNSNTGGNGTFALGDYWLNETDGSLHQVHDVTTGSADWREIVKLNADGELVGVFIPRHNTQTVIDEIVLEDGEIAFTTDRNEVRLGDGSTAGGIQAEVHYTAGELIDLSGTGVSNLTGAINPAGTSISGIGNYQYKLKVIAYRYVGIKKIYYDETISPAVEYSSNSESSYSVDFTWDSLPDADGYVVAREILLLPFLMPLVNFSDGFEDIGNQNSFSIKSKDSNYSGDNFDTSLQSAKGEALNVEGLLNITSNKIIQFDGEDFISKTDDGGISLGGSSVGSESIDFQTGRVSIENYAQGNRSFTFGYNNKVLGESIGIGDSNDLNFSGSIAVGSKNKGAGTMFGNNNRSSGSSHLLIGNNLSETGSNSSENNVFMIGSNTAFHNDGGHLISMSDGKFGIGVNKASVGVELNKNTIIEDFENKGSNIITNPQLIDTDANWDFNTNECTQGGGHIDKDADGVSAIQPPSLISGLTAGKRYLMKLHFDDIVEFIGKVEISMGGVDITEIRASGYYWLTFTAINTDTLTIQPIDSETRFRLEQVYVYELNEGDLNVLGGVKIGNNTTSLDHEILSNGSAHFNKNQETDGDVIISTENVVEAFKVDAGADKVIIDNIEVSGHSYATAEIDDGNSGTADTIDWTNGNYHKSTATGDCTYTFTAPSGPTTLVLKLVNGGAHSLTFPATVKWSSGIEPTWTTSGTDIITFYYDGTNYHGGAILDSQ